MTTEQATQKLGPALDNVSKAAARTAPTMKQAAMSANELRAATRQLPMQFTDIVTSLTSGQAPLQVLIQQGGQLKDTFGGVAPATRALGGYVAGLINPVTLAAAAVVALGVAWNQAENEAADFNKALILTGNQAGLTASQLEAMARGLDSSTSATQMKASAVLAEVAATGQFTADQIELVSRAAIAMEDATGKAVSETVKEFASLKGEPVQALLKLNETQHFLTEATLEQIKSLEAQGRTAEATAVAMKAYADSINERAPLITENLTVIGERLRWVKKEAAEFGDEIVAAFRDGDSEAARLLKSMAELARIGPFSGAFRQFANDTFSGKGAARDIGVTMIDPRNPASMNIRPPSGGGVVNSQQTRDRIAFEKQGLRYLDEQAKKKREIADVEKLIANGTIERVDGEKRIAEITADYADRAAKRTPKARAVSERDSGASLLEQIREQIALTEQEAASGEKATASDRLRVQSQSLLADSKSKVSAATREALDAGLKELEAAGQYQEIAQINALIDAEAADQYSEMAMARQRQADATAALIDNMRFEQQLLRASVVDREKMIALRYADASATDAQRAEIEKLAEETVRLREVEEVKGLFQDFTATAIADFSNIGDAFESLGDRMKRMAAEMLAEKAIQWIFGMFTGTGGGGNFVWGQQDFTGFARGGYTGPGGVQEPAGIVHKGEVVWSQQDVRRAGGVSAVEAMRLGAPGFSSGGVVGMYAPTPRAAVVGGDVNLIVENHGEPMRARTEEGTGPGGERFIKLILDAAEDRVAGSIGRMDKVGRAVQQRFGVSPQGVSRG